MNASLLSAAILSASFAASASPTVLYDDDSVPAITFGSNPSGTGGNGVGYWPGNTAGNQNAEFYALGQGDNYSLSFRGKGNWFFGFHATHDSAARLRLYENETNGMESVELRVPESIDATFPVILPDAPGTANDVLYTPDGYALKYGRPMTVAHAVANFVPSSSPVMHRAVGFNYGITRNGAGDYTLTMSSATADSASAVLVTAEGNGTALICTGSQPSTSTVRARCFNTSGSLTDAARVSVAVFGAP
ncbi:hypothetical protein [Tautonia plasticadhaerens]|uniref:Uncharacterized protein n=1 Tax=Tautonia plasticadhaerens TaxID=2527974 RepID=A0A518H220_9BACT|nr:hypothetical protein [Tautonia plasticadhaerens]QDV34891.1 hypothetical protein ElP_27880 [Tautonia plasticadhaerens]